MSSANPLPLENLFAQLDNDIRTHLSSTDGLDVLVLRINSYSRLIKAHPENTHTNPSIPSTIELMTKIDEYIKSWGHHQKIDTYPIVVKAYTRIIAGRK
jgi:hypothetical protein